MPNFGRRLDSSLFMIWPFSAVRLSPGVFLRFGSLKMPNFLPPGHAFRKPTDPSTGAGGNAPLWRGETTQQEDDWRSVVVKHNRKGRNKRKIFKQNGNCRVEHSKHRESSIISLCARLLRHVFGALFFIFIFHSNGIPLLCEAIPWLSDETSLSLSLSSQSCWGSIPFNLVAYIIIYSFAGWEVGGSTKIATFPRCWLAANSWRLLVYFTFRPRNRCTKHGAKFFPEINYAPRSCVDD